MAQAGKVVLGRFDQPVRQYKAPPAHALTEEFYDTDPKNDFARGFAVQNLGALPAGLGKQMLAAKETWGWGLRREMMDYNHWASFSLLGEILPWKDNRVTLSHDKDRFGLRVYLISSGEHIFTSDSRDRTAPPFRRDLAPPDTWVRAEHD